MDMGAIMGTLGRKFVGIIGFVAGTVSVLSCNARELYNGKDPVSFQFMEPIPQSSTLSGYPILSIGHDLKLIHLKTSYSTGVSLALGNASFVDVRDGKFFASIDMVANLETGNMSDWVDEPCKRDDFLWKRSTGGAFRRINCATMNHNTKFFANPTGDFQQYLVKFREMKLDLPPTIIRIDFTRYSEQGRRLVYRVRINPEMFGFERDAEPMWGANSWHKVFSSKDPKKAEFIAVLAKWAESVQDKMDDAFDKNPVAFSSTHFPTNYVISVADTAAQFSPALQGSGSRKSTEASLQELRSLFEKGLLNKDEYDSKRAEILKRL